MHVLPYTLSWLLPTLATAGILVGYDEDARHGPWWRRAVLLLTSAVILVFGAHGAYRAAAIVTNLPQWDFLAFWVPARVAALGKDFYDPRWLHRIPLPAPPSPDFSREQLDVGFLYPPWTMLLLGPLGLLRTRPAAFVWTLQQCAALLACIVVLWRVFLLEQGWRGLLFVAALILSFQPTTASLTYGQTNFLVLLLLVGFWTASDRISGGVYLGLAIMVKPVAAILLLYPLVRRLWRVLGGTIAVLLVAAVTSVSVFGWQVFTRYFVSNPAIKLPPTSHMEGNHQSILAAVLRTRPPVEVAALRDPLLDPTYLLLAGVLALITCWAIIRSRERAIGFTLLIPCAILVYPATITYYGVLLILPVLYLWRARKQLSYGSALTILVITGLYALTRVGGGSKSAYAYLLMWAVLVLLAIHRASVAPLKSPPGAEATFVVSRMVPL